MLSPEHQSAWMSKIANHPVWHRMHYMTYTHMTTVGIKGLMGFLVIVMRDASGTSILVFSL